MSEKIVIFGAGGHAKVAIDAIDMAGEYGIAFLADADDARVGSTVRGYLVCAEREGFVAGIKACSHAFVAIGHNQARKRVACMAKEYGFSLATIVHPGAIVSAGVTLGEGTLVMPRSVVNADAVIGANVIINTGAIVEHDCRVGDNSHVAPGATLCGGVTVGEDSLIGAGAIIVPGVKVGAQVIVGAGALVLSDVPDGAIAIGVPARIRADQDIN